MLIRIVAVGLILLMTEVTALHAQPAGEVGKTQKIVDPTGGLRVDPTGDQEEYRVIKLRPKLSEPNSKSRLFPDRSDWKPGNAAPIFLRQNFESSLAMERRKEFFRAEPGPLEKGLSDPRILEVESLKLYNVAELERAAYREHSGWEYPLYEPEYEGGGIEILLPDVQEIRICSLYLCELARAAIARGEPTKAERYVRIGMGLTRHLSETPFMVVKLVSAAQFRYYQLVMEELIQMPTAPNYYWDLTSLPRPMVELRSALQWEWNILPKAYPELLDLDAITTKEQWQKLHEKIVSGLIVFGAMPEMSSAQFEEVKKSWASKSREMLPKLDPPRAERVASMSDAETSLRYWWLRVQQLQNIQFEPCLLEPQYVVEEMLKREQQVAKLFEGEEFILQSIMPQFKARAVHAIWRHEQRIPQLRVVESIRHWSAEHNGELPASLADLTLPAPIDPLSGKPFEYKRAEDGKSAELRACNVKLPDVGHNLGFTYRLVRE